MRGPIPALLQQEAEGKSAPLQLSFWREPLSGFVTGLGGAEVSWPGSSLLI